MEVDRPTTSAPIEVQDFGHLQPLQRKWPRFWYAVIVALALTWDIGIVLQRMPVAVVLIGPARKTDVHVTLAFFFLIGLSGRILSMFPVGMNT